MSSPRHHADMSQAGRLTRYAAVSTTLALLSDQRLGNLVDDAPVVGTGIGGTSMVLQIDDTPVFAKRIPLSDLERRPENVMSTANLFGLPAYCHYGVGSAGGGVWREIAALAMTTGWVVGGLSENFPLTYHWRVLDGPPPGALTAEARAELDRTVGYWHGSPAVRERLEALASASASVVVFVEHIPQNLTDWLTTQVALGDRALESAAVMVERELRSAVSFMNANGLLHFDAHFGNVLTDGQRLYLADFGLATSPRFELSDDESAFLAANATHDGCYVVWHFVNWLVRVHTGVTDAAERYDLIRRYADGADPVGVPAWTVPIIKRYAPVTAVMNDFYWQLFGESRKTPFPVEDVRRVCAETGFEPILS